MAIPRAKSSNKSSGLRDIIRARNALRVSANPRPPASTIPLGCNRNVLRAVAKPSEPKKPAPPLIHQPLYLPHAFRQYIDSLGGQDVKLVMEKVLTRSDLHPDLARLTLPENQCVGDVNLLRKRESTVMMIKKEISVGVISSKLEEKALKLKIWMTFKKARIAGQPEPELTRVYTLRGGWLSFAKENNLKANDRVQLFSFRVIDEVLHESLKFLIVKLDGEKSED